MSGAGALLDRLVPPGAVTGGARAVRGRAWLDRHGLPTTREEAWRYTPVDDIIAALDGAAPADPAPDAVSADDVDRLAGDLGGPRLVFVNGSLAAGASDVDELPGGVWLGGGDALRARRRPGSPPPTDEPVDGFHALNWAAGTDAAAVFLAPGVTVDAPVHVVHLAVPGAGGGSGASISHPRTVVRVGDGSSVSVVETYAGLAGPTVTNASTRILAGDGATVTYRRVQAEPDDAIHVGRTGIELSAGARVRATSVMTGAAIARSAVDVAFGGPDGRADLDGLYLPADRQRHDHVVTVDHAASHCTSTQRFHGIVDDHARGSFSGHVIVRPGTVATDADQVNRNLVLAPTAQADTRPWLEILADDVRCTHGATVGRLDDEALFYLRSRGIPLAESRALLVAAFAAAVVDGITPERLRERLAAGLAERFGGATA